MRKSTVTMMLLGGCLSIAALTILFLWYFGFLSTRDYSPLPRAVLAESVPGDVTEFSAEERNNIQVYERVSPSVVNITTIEVSYDFFLNASQDQGTGSGSVLDQSGHILTNYHVVENADYIQVMLTDKLKYKAEMVGFDEVDDLAVLRINAPPDRLRPIPLGSSGKLKVGQSVYAIGNPFGLNRTMSRGIISSLGRSIKSKAGYIIDDVIQTDASINPGNSGGPLLDSGGRMIGVTTSIFTTSGGSIGIGFSVPIDTVRTVANDLIQFGRVRRPWIGIYGQDITPEAAQYLELPAENGVLVAYVEPGSSADAAGILGGDRRVRLGIYRLVIGGDYIVQVNDRPVVTLADLTSYLLNQRPGDTVTVTLYRGGKKIQLPVKLIEKSKGMKL